MLINRDCKMSIVHPLPDYIHRIAQHMPYRSRTVKNLKNELFPILKKVNNDITAPYTKRPNDLKCEQNVSRLVCLIQDAGVLPEVQD